MLEQPHREFGLGRWVWQSGRGFLLEQPHKEFGLESWVWWVGRSFLLEQPHKSLVWEVGLVSTTS